MTEDTKLISPCSFTQVGECGRIEGLQKGSGLKISRLEVAEEDEDKVEVEIPQLDLGKGRPRLMAKAFKVTFKKRHQ